MDADIGEFFRAEGWSVVGQQSLDAHAQFGVVTFAATTMSAPGEHVRHGVLKAAPGAALKSSVLYAAVASMRKLWGRASASMTTRGHGRVHRRWKSTAPSVMLGAVGTLSVCMKVLTLMKRTGAALPRPLGGFSTAA